MRFAPFRGVMPRATLHNATGGGWDMPKRYEALRGGGGGVTSVLRNAFFFF